MRFNNLKKQNKKLKGRKAKLQMEITRVREEEKEWMNEMTKIEY